MTLAIKRMFLVDNDGCWIAVDALLEYGAAYSY